jgi:adenosylhomocysteinase
MATAKKNYKVKDIRLAANGRMKIEWAESRMPVLMALREKYRKSKPLKGFRIAGCLHVTKETAVLVETLTAAGAEVSWSGCNPLSTNDEVAAALAAKGVSIYAWHGMNVKEFYWAIDRTLDFKPNLTLDDGADLIFTIHNKHKKLIPDMLGGTEETTTGVHRLRAMADAGELKYPVIAVNDAETKWDFDNVYGTGAIHSRRYPACDQHTLRRQECCHRRLWPLRQGSRGSRQGTRRQYHRYGNQTDRRPESDTRRT